jgi:hypothetical protein
VVSVVAIAGCGFPHGTLSRDDAPIVADDDAPRMIDAAIDAAADASIDAAPNLGSCNTTALTCLGGTPVAVTCNAGCWVRCQQSTPVANEPAAAAACAAWGGKLAPIRSQQDNDCVAITLFPSQSSWIGYEQDAAATMKGTGWSWNHDGVASSYTNWSSGQPNDNDGTENGEEQCAYMPTNGTWQDVACSDASTYRFSCRR